MRLEKCFFCSATCYPGHGITFVRNDSKIFKFCRSKCHAAFKKKKNPRKTRWTKAYRKSTGKELTQDPSMELEKKRHVPQKYSRALWGGTVEGMKTALEIRGARESLHVLKRLRKGEEVRKAADRVNVKRNIALIRSPAATAVSSDPIIAKALAGRKASVPSAKMEVEVDQSSSEEEEEPEEHLMEAN